VAEGPPEVIARTPASATGQYLVRVLRGEPLVPLSDVSFAEEAGRAHDRNGHSPAEEMPLAPSRKRATAASRRG
jgi:hypothetical protein